MAELKVCPFCGSNEVSCWMSSSRFSTWKNSHYVKCYVCGAMTEAFPSEEEALDAWNRRTTNDLINT